MEENIRIWRVENDDLNEIRKASLDLESMLEIWLESDISILSDKLLIIGRQVITDYGGKIDLLCLDDVGDIVVVELKRELTPREVTAQALDYASWAKDLSNERITSMADDYLSAEGGLSNSFRRKFKIDLPSVLNANHKMLIVGSNIDDSTMRIINYLSEDYGVGINYATFQYFKDDKNELLARVFLINPDEVEKRAETGAASKRNPNLDYNQLVQIATDRGNVELFSALVDRLRPLFDKTRTTRSSMVFKGRRGDSRVVIISLIPKEEENATGLKFQLYEKRLCEHLGIERDELLRALPSDSHEWSYDNGGPDWSGYEGRFKTIEEVTRFLNVMRKK